MSALLPANPDVMSHIFNNLNSGNSLKLSRTAKSMTQYIDEDFWRTKVMSEYGPVNQQFGSWLETAKHLAIYTVPFIIDIHCNGRITQHIEFLRLNSYSSFATIQDTIENIIENTKRNIPYIRSYNTPSYTYTLELTNGCTHTVNVDLESGRTMLNGKGLNPLTELNLVEINGQNFLYKLCKVTSTIYKI